jgi:hypothetical protein
MHRRLGIHVHKAFHPFNSGIPAVPVGVRPMGQITLVPKIKGCAICPNKPRSCCETYNNSLVRHLHS